MKLRKLMVEAGHGEHVAEAEKLLQPAFFIRAKKLAPAPDEEDEPGEFDQAMKKLPLGASRFGGFPDLPPGVALPRMALVAQLRLGEVRDPRLPSQGSLLFFQGDEDCQVLFHDGPLVRTASPHVHGLAALRFQRYQALPTAPSPFVSEALGEFWPDFLIEHANQLAPEVEDAYRENHLFGYPDEPDDEKRLSRDDQLLLQVDSDDSAGFMWGDCQKLFFVLTSDELARRDFSRVRVYSMLG